MIFRNSEGIQDLADGRAVADALELVDPDGTDTEGPGCDEDVLKSTGVVSFPNGLSTSLDGMIRTSGWYIL